MADTVKVIINDQEYQLPAGANLVDAARTIGNDIPVFCYHPKMQPVGMCRMCLVEMGTVQKDRETGDVLVDESGNPQVRWFPKLQTGCTTTVSDGLVIRTDTPQVDQARKNILEFLLTSHPLDCPVCDKGGECPLQNLTMEHGPGTTRMNYADKQHLDKHVPLGDLIFLDEERCIQCARCIRFQGEIVGDDVLAFHERGRRLQIITVSDPGFDSYFSGNTTDICPVGALTSADFRFGARPWEMTEIPSIDPYDASGSNLSLSTRLDRDAGGRAIIKRVMPRQNEYVNEIWISDKARFGHHFTRSADRLAHPLRGEACATWQESLNAVADKLKSAGSDIGVIAGSGLSNEDLFALRQLVTGLGSDRLGVWPPTHAGADLVAQVGVGQGTNFKDVKAGDAVLVIATDLEEEVPIWYLHAKRAHDRGAYVVVANARGTRLDDFASAMIRYESGQAAQALLNIRQNNGEIAQKLADANNLVVIAGAEGLTLDGSRALMQAAANFLIETQHVGKPNNGLLSPIPGPNGMGQYYMGFTPENTQAIVARPPRVLIVAQADVLADDPDAARWLGSVDTIINLTLFQDELSQAAITLPIQSFAERDGTYTSGDRRVQRFYVAQGPVGEALPAWQAVMRIGELLGQGKAKLSAAAVMQEITQTIPAFAECSYKNLAWTEVQTPAIGDDVWYGGTAYKNRGGLGVQIASVADAGTIPSVADVSVPAAPTAGQGKLLVIPTVRLYNRERIFRPSAMMHGRVPEAYIGLSEEDAARLKVAGGDYVEIDIENGPVVQVRVVVDAGVPVGSAVLPRHLTTTAMPLALAAASVSKVNVPQVSKV